MARASKREVSSDEAYSSEEEEQVNDQANVEEDDDELEAVARSAGSDEEDVAPDEAPVSDDEVVPVEDDAEEDEEDEEKAEISKREKARLKEMQKMKKQKIQQILDSQNASIDADMNNKGKGRIKYLLQQTELFAHFAKSDPSPSQKKGKGRCVECNLSQNKLWLFILSFQKYNLLGFTLSSGVAILPN
jgi:SWI/SNF-related matrix-associated actin-dependent regulator of chromatin subfamily A member 5